MKYFFGTLIVLQVLLILYYVVRFSDTHDFYYVFWMFLNVFGAWINFINLNNEINS